MLRTTSASVCMLGGQLAQWGSMSPLFVHVDDALNVIRRGRLSYHQGAEPGLVSVCVSGGC